MSSQERRRAIVKAVVPVFAEKGFHAATTKELARAAGVSEALLYRHFPSKEALYAAIGTQHLEEDRVRLAMDRLFAGPPSTARLVRSVGYLVRHVADPRGQTIPRLMAQSLLGDGSFARVTMRSFASEWEGYFVEDIEAARAAGDLEGEADTARLGVWFAHHLAMALRLMALPDRQVVDYGRRRRAVVEEAVRFALRGLGLRKKAMDKYLTAES